MIARFWDNSKGYHETLLWEGTVPQNWVNWGKWVNAKPPKKGQAPDPFWDVSLEYTK